MTHDFISTIAEVKEAALDLGSEDMGWVILHVLHGDGDEHRTSMCPRGTGRHLIVCTKHSVHDITMPFYLVV